MARTNKPSRTPAASRPRGCILSRHELQCRYASRRARAVCVLATGNLTGATSSDAQSSAAVNLLFPSTPATTREMCENSGRDVVLNSRDNPTQRRRHQLRRALNPSNFILVPFTLRPPETAAAAAASADELADVLSSPVAPVAGPPEWPADCIRGHS